MKMVNRNNKNAARDIDKSSENDSQAVFTYGSELLSSRNPQTKDKPANDDLIIALSDAYENRRDRQVTEWERMRRQYVRHAV